MLSQITDIMMSQVTDILFTLAYVFAIGAMIVAILFENRNPVKAIAWILVLVFLPVVGFFCYILFGKKFRKKRIINKRSLHSHKAYVATDSEELAHLPLTPDQRSVASLAMSNSDAVVAENNKVEIYTQATQLFDSIFEDIKQAKSSIHLEYYIFSPDKIGRKMMDALMDKAREGVQVRVIVDDVGSWELKKKHIREMVAAGIEVKSFLVVSMPFISTHVNYRNHRKILVIDGKIGYTGGMNIADRYIEGVEWGTWRDTHVRLEGAIVSSLQKPFFEDWYFVTQQYIDDEQYYPTPELVGKTMMQAMVSGPDMQWESIKQVFAKSFAMAKKRIYVETPYFLPPDSILSALQSASLSGVDVRLILPRKADAPLTLYASYSYISQLLQAGVKIYFYQSGFIHSKITIVDDDISFVGSANMDFRSFDQNFELNTIIYDPEVARQLLAIYEADLQDSVMVEAERWSQRKWSKRLMESFSRLFSPLL